MNHYILNRNGDKGFNFEKEFEYLAIEYNLPIVRADAENLCNPDYTIGNYAFDPKLKIEVFRKSKYFVGLDPMECVVFDMHKINSYVEFYNETGKIVILIVKIDYKYLDNVTEGIYLISIDEIVKLIILHPERIRKFQDHEKNKILERFYVSTLEMHEISLDEMFKALKNKIYTQAT